ncbi:gamma-glutamyl-gamma-aminobutyrate hydrolase family protein [Marinifilum sp. D714]|uniref:glutamine amidotransferase-related protein n=1 Tax=Marinifilum sp. D714 TaxID=2937523 RepID=UPI0027CECD93|nr:gamma-glutamyl-gamma-aminobutyrate hydrolase family protein [Marinifilum sp. D714]MDQ2178769.1 gamma-glutamyl-gamma-aminobutyrate hydrolase family protein [Marinifilum sp. D714]
MLLIIDNQSAFIKKFKRNFLAEIDFETIFFDHNQPLNLPDNANIQGIILSGGKGNPYEPLNLTTNFVAILNFQVPVLGLCLGHEIIAVSNMGRIKKLKSYNNKKELVRIKDKNDPIFESIDHDEIPLVKKHNWYVSQLPAEFISLGESDTCVNEIIRHNSKPIYGFQSHPEVSGEVGIQIMINFLKICKLYDEK